MKRTIYILFALFILSGHDMFLKLDSYFLEPNKPASIHLYNGTFDRSDNAITRDRMLDVTIKGNSQSITPGDSMWTDVGPTPVLNFLAENSGTYVAGVSTAARSIEMSAEDFNGYLEHDGVLDVLEQRKKEGTTGAAAVEKYSKHVKVIFQVGEEKTSDWDTNLNYPIEFIPQSNPYELKIGDKISAVLLRDGKPLVNQLVQWGTESHEHEDGHTHEESGEDHKHNEVQLRTNSKGIVETQISASGKWYFRTIHMIDSKEEGFTHESNWATITFEVLEGENSAGHTHDHVHNTALPWYVWGVGLLMIMMIFYLLWSRRV